MGMERDEHGRWGPIGWTRQDYKPPEPDPEFWLKKLNEERDRLGDATPLVANHPHVLNSPHTHKQLDEFVAWSDRFVYRLSNEYLSIDSVPRNPSG